MGGADSEELGRLRWRCRRGMKELDVLLTRFVDEEFAEASIVQREAFLALLDAPDPRIWAYCLGLEQPPTPALDSLIRRITRA
jgi:antitoxin CptB